MFWAALSDLPRPSVMTLLQAMWCADTELPEEILHWKDSVALLDSFQVALVEHPTVVSEFSMNVRERTLYLPSSSNFSTMQLSLKQFVDSM